MVDEAIGALERLAERFGDAEIGCTLFWNPKEPEGERWGGMVQFGREAPDSDMVGGMSCAIGQPTAQAALEFMMRECGVLK